MDGSDSIERLMSSALTPAVVIKGLVIGEERRVEEVTVTDSTLSAAIGKKGSNIKLASRLTKWNLQLTNRLEKTDGVGQKKL